MIDPTEHETYTIDSRYACQATGWGGNHTCHCVYRRAVCDGLSHLCMCGSEWSDAMTGPYSRCDCNHERNTMATPTGIHLSAHKGEFKVEVSISTDSAISPDSVLDEQLRRAMRAFGILLRDDTRRPVHDDDLDCDDYRRD